MEKDVLALAGAFAGFIAAILTIIDRLLTLRERAAAAARSSAPRIVDLEDGEEEGTEDPGAVPRTAPSRSRRRRWWTLHWPSWLGPPPSYLIPNELAVIVGAGVLLNSLGLLLSLRLESILFLDMIGTAFAAFLLGPWWGAATALLTNALVNWLLYPQNDPDLMIFPWALVNMAGGFYWGLLSRSGWFRTYLQSGHTSVVSHVTFLAIFGALGACVMGLPGAWIQQIVSHTTNTTINPTIVVALRGLIEQGQDLLVSHFDAVTLEDVTDGVGALLLVWIHTCLLYIPDKVVSVAIAMTLIKRGFPIFEQELLIGRSEEPPPVDNRLAPMVLGLLYAPIFGVLISGEAYLGQYYWPLWASPWLFVAGGYVWLKRHGLNEEDLRAARIDRAARYREECRPIQQRPASSFCQRLTVGWLMASTLFALFMPVMLDDYSSVAFNFFCLVYGSMLGLYLMRVSLAQNIAAVRFRESTDDELPVRPRRRRTQAA